MISLLLYISFSNNLHRQVQIKDKLYYTQKELRKNIFESYIEIVQYIMQYSPSQYRKVEQQFLQQFELKTLDFYDNNANSDNLIQYKRILNQMMTRKNQNIGRRDKIKWLNARQKSGDASIVQKNNQTKKQESIDSDDDNVGFYLTENPNNFASNQKIKEITSLRDNLAEKNRLSILQKLQQSTTTTKLSSMSLKSIKNQNLNIDNINDRIYSQFSVSQCLCHEQSQVQDAIFCFKKRIQIMQQLLNTEQIKLKQVDRLLSQGTNRMLRSKYTNKQIKASFSKTKKHFQLDLEGRKQLQQKFSQKNRQQFEQNVVDHIYLKKMQQHLLEQQQQLKRLDKQRKQLDLKQKKYLKIYNKQQELYRAYCDIKHVQQTGTLKKSIVSILDKDFEQLLENNEQQLAKAVSNSNQRLLAKKSKLKVSLTNIQAKLPLATVVNQLVELYTKEKQQSQSRITEFNLLIQLRDEKQSQLNKTIQKMIQDYGNLFEKMVEMSHQDKQRLRELSQEIRIVNDKKNQLGRLSTDIEQRLKFSIQKKLGVLKRIIQTWMKSDKLSTKFLTSMFQKLNEIVSSTYSSSVAPKQPSPQAIKQIQLHFSDSKSLLIKYFQNWPQYLYFLEILHDTSLIYRFLSPVQLQRLFKRIIKTKLKNSQIKSQDIFQKALQLAFEQGRKVQTHRISNLLALLKQLQDYYEKVNSKQIELKCTISYDMLVVTNIQHERKDSQQINDMSSRLPLRNQYQLLIFQNSPRQQPSNNDNMFSQDVGIVNNKKEYKEMDKMNSKRSLKIPNVKTQDMVARLKKRTKVQKTLDIHDFYQNLRQQIQKINKMSNQYIH